MLDDDETLMIAYQAGDELAFQKLYQRFGPKLYSYLNKRIPAYKDEVYQIVFLKVHEKRDTYIADFRFAPWFFTIARNCMIDFLRREKRAENSHQFDENIHGIANQDVGDVQLKGEELLQIDEVVTKLDEADRAILELRFTKELDYNEIALRLGISAPTARKRLSRILAKIRRVFP